MEALAAMSLSYIGMTIELYSITFQTATITLHVLLSRNPYLSITRSHIQISGNYIIQDLYVIELFCMQLLLPNSISLNPWIREQKTFLLLRNWVHIVPRVFKLFSQPFFFFKV